MSLEKLDRASPDLWPEQSKYILYNFIAYFGQELQYIIYILTINEVPGVNEFVAQNSPQTEPSSWAAGLTPDDINQLHRKFTSRNTISYKISFIMLKIWFLF